MSSMLRERSAHRPALAVLVVSVFLLPVIAGLVGCSSKPAADKDAGAIDLTALEPPPPPPPARGAPAAAAGKPAPSTWRERQKAASAAAPTSTMPAASMGAPLTEADVRELAARVEQASAAGDVEAIGRLVDFGAITDTASAGLDMSAKDKADVEKAVRAGLSGPGSLLAEMAIGAKKGHSYKFLRCAERSDHRAARFRQRNAELAINYHDLILARRTDGQVRIVDVYVYIMGETIADTLRRGLVAALAARPKGFFRQLTPKDREFIEAAPRAQQMGNAMKARRFSEVLSIIRGLPESVRTMKPVMIARISALSNLQMQEELVTATNEYQAMFPGDPSCDLICMDALVVRKRYDDVLTAVDRLERSIGGDPCLGLLRALALFLNEKPDAAAQAARKVLEQTPAELDAHRLLAVIDAKDEKYAAVAARLDEMKEKYGFDIEEIGRDSRFLGFASSPAGKAWLQKHGLAKASP